MSLITEVASLKMAYVDNIEAIALAITLGAALGGLYFLALWMTLLQLTETRHPAFMLVCSLLLRISLLLAAFYWILGSGHWEQLLAALAGFIVVRTICTRHIMHGSLVADSHMNGGVIR